MIRERKMFFAWQQQKEKNYLEKKAMEGLLLKKMGLGYYDFEESEPKDMVYEFDFRMINKKQLEEYLEMFQDWEMVIHYGGWFYFRKERTLNNEIYNDFDSKKNMFTRLLGFLLLAGFPLYYQVLILFPYLERTNRLTTFYKYFRPFTTIILVLHTYAIVKILLVYFAFRKNMKE